MTLEEALGWGWFAVTMLAFLIMALAAGGLV